MPTTKQQRAEKAKAAATEMHARMVAAIESAIKSPREWTDYTCKRVTDTVATLMDELAEPAAVPA